MRKDKNVLYLNKDHKAFIVSAILTRRNTTVEVYSIGLPASLYKTKDIDQAIIEYTKKHGLSKVIKTCHKCYEHISEQDSVPEHDHIYECANCGHQTRIKNIKEEI